VNKKHNLVYKTTNLINQKIYIGVHSTNDIEDGYIGSGKTFKHAIKKYGKENFTRELLFDFPTPEEAYAKEKELVDLIFINRKDNYNFKEGGEQGKISEATRLKLKQKTCCWRGKKGKDHPWFGRNHSEKTKNKLSIARMGNKNPMFGRTGDKHSGFGKPLSNEHKKSVSFGHLGEDGHNQRIQDIQDIEKNVGWMAELSRKWGICPRSGLMFIKKWYPDYQPRKKKTI
jgi:group I intron endonuclease